MQELALSAFEFMQELSFNEDGKTRMVEYNLQRQIKRYANSSDITVQAPFFSLVPLPSLLVDDIQVDFQMEVTTTEISAKIKSRH